MEFIIGADPGKKGGLVVLDRHGKIVDMLPTKCDKEGNIDALAIFQFVSQYSPKNTLVYKEEVHAIFGSSAVAMFEFGKSDGVLEAILFAAGFKFNLVQPKIWQKVAWLEQDKVQNPTGKILKGKKGLPQMKVDTKASSLNAAIRIFPETNFIQKRCRVPHDGLVDAALIAFYGLSINSASYQ